MPLTEMFDKVRQRFSKVQLNVRMPTKDSYLEWAERLRKKKALIYIPAVLLLTGATYWVMAGRPSRDFSLGELPVKAKATRGQTSTITRKAVAHEAASAPIKAPRGARTASTGQAISQQPVPPKPAQAASPVIKPEPVLPATPPPVPVVKAPAAGKRRRALVTRSAEKVEQRQEQIKPFILEDPFSQDVAQIARLKKELEMTKLRLEIAKAQAEINKLAVKERASDNPPPALPVTPIGPDVGMITLPSGGMDSGSDIRVRGIARTAYGDLSAILENDAGRWIVRVGDVVDNRWVVVAIGGSKVVVKRKGGKEEKELYIGARVMQPSGAMQQIGAPPPPGPQSGGRPQYGQPS